MKAAAQHKLETGYKAALEDCLSGVGESALQCAYELGHQAVQDGLGLMHILSIHKDLLLDLLSKASTTEECSQIARVTHDLLVECLVPFEFTHRGFREIESAKRDMESFSYSISHDLRAPLRSIEGFAKILAGDIGDRLSDDERRKLNVIRENVQKMEKMIEGLLAFSRLGRSAIRLSVFDIRKLADEIWEEQRLLNPGRDMALQNHAPPQAYADRDLIREVLLNLLSNAVKFTKHKERALIEFGGKTEGRENVYCVKDNGAGFDMHYYDKLFGVFQRLHNTSEFEGTGVGLAIVQRIIRRHGGRVWAEGKPGEGAAFYFTLPGKED